MVRWKDKEASIRALERDGRVDPEDLIKAARSPSHPCHEDFTWDVEKAARERWRDQARAIIRRWQFEVIVEELTEPVVRYVPTDDDDDGTFLSLPKVRSVTRVSNMLAAEVAMLHGMAARVYGIALAKSGMIDGKHIATLRNVRETLRGLNEELQG